jgi:hypothetical protein
MTGRDLRGLPLSALGDIVAEDWPKPYFGAVPYIAALRTLASIDDTYGVESGHDIVAYFLSNANTWRGPVAREVKQELRRRCRWTS